MWLKNILKYFPIYFLLALGVKQIDAVCTKQEFECNNGECISQFELCDGLPNCSDSSDETEQNCIHRRSECKKPFFRCAYGACVIGSASCNKEKDCADGSDETLLRCSDQYEKENYERRLQGNCNQDELKCPNGICIENYKKCDGYADCDHNFDETVELCAHLECPFYSFTCGYGGCISNNLVCNDHNDCRDGSDETDLLCNRSSSKSTHFMPTQIPFQSAVTTTVTQQNIGCPLPKDIQKPLLRDRFGNNKTEPILSGEVHFTCKKGYMLVGYEVSFCSNQKWSVDVPKCVKYCNPGHIGSGYSIKATCHYKGELVPCNRKHPPGTEVNYLCATYFQNTTTLPTLRCLDGGKWSDYRPRCISQCGEIATPTKEYSAFGFTVNNSVVPWHVGIYGLFDEVKFKFQCGGSILTADIVLTAAHCVWDKAELTVYSLIPFQIVAAKYYRDYDHDDHTAVRKNASKIIVHPQYKGASSNYLNDIAVIILKGFLEFSELIRPVCLNFYERSRKDSITNNIDGRFSGWDISGERTFQFIEANSQSYQNCLSEHTDLADDKFCILNKGASRACRGDSGSGFTYQVEDKQLGTVRLLYNLLGIISNAPGANQCTAGIIALTNIQHHKEFIEKQLVESYQRS